MSNQITVNRDVIVEIRKKVSLFREEAEEALKNAERSVHNAEIEGWNDSRYEEFYDMYSEIQQNLLSEFKRIDEEIIPYLRRMEVSFDDFFA